MRPIPLFATLSLPTCAATSAARADCDAPVALGTHRRVLGSTPGTSAAPVADPAGFATSNGVLAVLGV